MINRRSFLKMVGITPAVIAIPAFALEPVVPTEVLVAPVAADGFMREVIGFDISVAKFLIRHDIMFPDGKSQLCVQQEIDGPIDDENLITFYRASARSALKQRMDEHGIDWGDLLRLRLPENLEVARYV